MLQDGSATALPTRYQNNTSLVAETDASASLFVHVKGKWYFQCSALDIVVVTKGQYENRQAHLR